MPDLELEEEVYSNNKTRIDNSIQDGEVAEKVQAVLQEIFEIKFESNLLSINF